MATVPPYRTTAQVISDAAIELGLVSADISDPFASTDANILQLVRLLNSLGQELTMSYEWPRLLMTHTFNTVASQATYSLPSGFGRMVDQSAWNRSTRFPFSGNIPPQGWEYLKALPSTLMLTALFRQQGQKLEVYPTPSSAQTVAFEYCSLFWITPDASASGDSTVPSQDRTTLASDILFFWPLLLVKGLRLSFLRAKGFDTTSAQRDYSVVLEQAKGQAPGSPLSLNGDGFTPLIGNANFPLTGYGS